VLKSVKEPVFLFVSLFHLFTNVSILVHVTQLMQIKHKNVLFNAVTNYCAEDPALVTGRRSAKTGKAIRVYTGHF
jgi:hypothetical protein